MKRVADTEAGPWILRFLRAHVRLWTAVAIGLVVFVALVPTWIALITRLLIAWDIGIVVYLALTAVTMARSTPRDIRYHAAIQDEGAVGLLMLSVAATTASFGAIFAELAAIERSAVGYGFEVALALATVILSWMFTHTIFALHYAHEFHGSGRREGGLQFPGDEPPDYWDFVYFSFVIGMTFQVSDIAITHKAVRRTVIVHAALSFVFSVAILALAVNIAASLVGR